MLSAQGIKDEQRTTSPFHGGVQGAGGQTSVEAGCHAGQLAQELGITSSQLKGWRLELEAAGSAEAVRRQKSEAAELAELRRENRRLKEEVEVMRKASAFFAQWAAKP